jgi:hypothetical protein
VEKLRRALPAPLTLLRIGLALFVLVWIFGPYSLRSSIPIWLPFLVALGLELHFLISALRSPPVRRADRGPQETDRERYGYGEGEELLLIRDRDEEFWIPYSGETDEQLDELIAEARERPAPEAPPPVVEDGGRRPFRRFAIGVGVIAALALTFWIVESRTGWNGLDRDVRAEATARFSAEASRVAQKPVSIRCDEGGDYVGAVQHADGVAVVGGDLAYLTPERCLDLYRLAFKGEVRSNGTGRALAVLAHEAWHLRGLAAEGTTECYALQSGVEIGRRLGLSADSARNLMRRQLVENELRGRASPEYRIPPECRDGGRLDLDPESAEFP